MTHCGPLLPCASAVELAPGLVGGVFVSAVAVAVVAWALRSTWYQPKERANREGET